MRTHRGTWDKSYSNSAYPKVVIRPEDMDIEERTFFNQLIAAIGNAIDLDDLAVEQRNGDYRTVVSGSWDNDVLRYRIGKGVFWVSVRMTRENMDKYQDSPLFAAQENKKQFHWRSSIRPDEIAEISGIIIESALFFRGSLDNEHVSKGSKSSAAEPITPRARNDRRMPKSVVDDLVMAWNNADGDKRIFKQQLASKGYGLFCEREITLAVTNAYKAAASLKGGEVLECRCEEDNPYDDKAVAVFIKGGAQVGYLPKSGAKLEAFEALKGGHEIAAIVTHRGTRAGSKRDRTHILLVEAV